MTVQTLGDGMFDAKPRPRLAWQWQPLVPIGIAAFSLSSLISYHVRQPEVHSALQAVVSGIYRAIGFVPACMFFILVLAWSSIWFVRGELVRPGARVLRLCGFTLATAMLVNLRSDDGLPPPVHAGVIGHWLAARLMNVFGYVLSILMVAPAFFVTCVLATDWFFARFFDDLLTTGPRTDDADRLGGEVGVEAAATEHLKGLALAGLQPPAASPLASTAVMTPAGMAQAEDEDEAELDAMASAIAETDEEPRGEEGPRLTAYERRRLAAQQLAAAIERASQEAEAEDEAEAAAEARAEAEAAAETRAELEVMAAQDETVVEIGVFEDTADDDATDDDAADDAELDADAAADDLDVVVSVPTVPLRSVPVPGLGGLPFAAEDAPTRPAAELDDDEKADLEADLDLEVDLETEAVDADAAAAAAELETEAFALDDDMAAVESLTATDAPGVIAAAAAADAEAAAEAETEADSDADAGDEGEAVAPDAPHTTAAAALAGEPMVAIPRPPEGVRQRHLFAEVAIDDDLLREAQDLILDSRRASATMLQRKLRIDYEQAMAVLAALAQRGVIELQEGESTGRVLH